MTFTAHAKGDNCISIPRDSSFNTAATAVKVHKKHPEAVVAYVDENDGLKTTRDVVYKTIPKTKYGNRELHVDIIRPDDGETYPALLMIHGGGWSSGSRSMQEPMARMIAAKGYVTIPVEYRLTPEAGYPAGLHDVKEAVRWVRKNAAKFGIDPNRIAISGSSAGAQLATLVGVTNGSSQHEEKCAAKRGSAEVQAVINMDGIATFISDYNLNDVRERFEQKGVMPVNAQWLGGMPDDAFENWREASALEWITPKSAPICFISSDLPRYSDGRDTLCEKYAALGLKTEKHRVPVDVHPFWLFHPWVDTAVDFAVDYLNRTFKPESYPAIREYRLPDFGVMDNDSTLVQTAAIQKVIDRAETDGGGVIVVPKGVFLTGALFFKPDTSLRLEEGARLKGSDNEADFPVIPSRMEGKSIYYNAALINAYHVDGFRIEGPGTLDGNGFRYWERYWQNVEQSNAAGRKWNNLETHRPRVVFLWGCDNATLNGVRVINSPFWSTHYYMCENLLIENCYFYSPAGPIRAANTDCIDLDGCHKVHIRGCYLDCYDDGVCLKGGKGVYANRSYEDGSVTDVLVENCIFGDNLHGTLTLGSECVHADNILVRNCRVKNHCALLRMKMRPDTWQTYENITIENITGTYGRLVEVLPWKQFFDLEGSGEHPVGIIRNVTLRNITGKCDNLGVIAANPGDSVENFLLENITLKAKTKLFQCNYPSVRLENVTVNGSAPTIAPVEDSDSDALKFDTVGLKGSL